MASAASRTKQRQPFWAALLIIHCCCITACTSVENYAPVTEISLIEPIPKNATHYVMPGETIYEIAFRYGLDYRELAAQNNIDASYLLKVGQSVSLKRKAQPAIKKMHEAPPERIVAQIPEAPVTKKVAIIAPFVNVVPKSNTRWWWPARGRVIQTFCGLQKGINISADRGTAIHAAKAGIVVYSGDGLARYGHLIIIKHDNLYFSAYAHNDVVFVREGDQVRQGQKIAEMGDSGTNRTMLHFEIRKAGKPIDPLPLLRS